MNSFALLRSIHRECCLLATFVSLSLLGSSAKAQTPPAIFPVTSTITLPAGGNPVYTADFNGDGKLDMAYYLANAPASVGILLNFDSGAPTAVTTPLCVAGASQPSFADVNN